MKDVSINIGFLTKNYFYFDEPVPYKLKNNTEIKISPVSLKDSELFLSGLNVLSVDKNDFPDVKIIQMSYLQFIAQVLMTDEKTGSLANNQLAIILMLCLGLKNPSIKWSNEKSPYIFDSATQVKINAKEFDEIKKIILYQNLPHYEDEYMNPDLKKAIAEVDELENRNKVIPTLERKMAIITSHTGLPKREQELMSFRSHTLLFEEVCGEVEFTTTRPVMLFGGKGNEMEHWIYKNNTGKYDKYFKSVDSYTKSMGGEHNMIKSSNTDMGDSYMQQFNNFTK